MNSNEWMNRLFVRNEQLLHLAAGGLIVLCMVGCYFVRGALAQSVEEWNSESQEYSGLCDSELQISQSLESSKESRLRLEEMLNLLRSRIPERVVDSEVLSSVRGIVQASRCNMIDFRPSTTTDEVQFKTRSFDLQLEGDFKCIYQFFESLNQSQFVYQVGRFSIVEATTPGGAYHLNLELKVVFDHVLARSQ